MPTVYGLARFYSDAPPHAQVVYHFSITPPACMTLNPQLRVGWVGCSPTLMTGGFQRNLIFPGEPSSERPSRCQRRRDATSISPFTSAADEGLRVRAIQAGVIGFRVDGHTYLYICIIHIHIHIYEGATVYGRTSWCVHHLSERCQEEARCHVHQPLHQRCGRRFGCQGHAGWRDRVEASWPNICV